MQIFPLHNTLSLPCGERKILTAYMSALDREGRTIWIVDAHRGDGRRFVVHADEKLTAFVELERQVLTVTFYLESIHADAL